MRKQFTIFLILVFILGLAPVNFSNAITQNQIDAEVQIVCTDGSDNWFSGSGTIIDPKGIILTNRHVVEGAYMNTCFIGFIESISQEPNFGTAGNYNLAEVKYQTVSNDMDAAILYLDNPTNKTYPYINIWDSNSDALQFGDKIEVIGFPSIGGSTITYTSGDFSGFGSSADGTQNYIKSTAPLEHGNSGGASYNSSGQFIGIPTMVVAGTLNSMSYVLSVNSIKSWLSGVLGSGYQAEIIDQEPIIEEPTVYIQEDITPPNFDNLDSLCYNIFNDDGSEMGARCFPNKLGKIENFSPIQFVIYKSELAKIEENGLSAVYYYFGSGPKTILDDNAIKHLVTDYSIDRLTLTDKINITKPGSYFLTFFAVDNNGNISNPFVYEYVYEPEIFKNLQRIHFYSDLDRKKYINGYDITNYGTSYRGTFYGAWGYGANICYTRLNNLTLTWEFSNNYNNYIFKKTNSYNIFPYKAIGDLISDDYVVLNNLSIGNSMKYKEYIHSDEKNGIYYEFFIKPYIASSDIEHKHKFLRIVYDKNLSADLVCSTNETFLETSNQPIIIDPELAKRLKGNILLQVEKNGEAYYIYPNDSKKYYLGRPADAFNAMRKLGLGATHQFINSYTTYPDHVLGKILIDVEQNGEAYYIYPKDKKAYYLGRPADAFRIMRELGLGITNSDLSKIPEGSL
ncbi:MAG: S1C family serine protease [Candidatus Falkowbacteria bacterium]